MWRVICTLLILIVSSAVYSADEQGNGSEGINLIKDPNAPSPANVPVGPDSHTGPDSHMPPGADPYPMIHTPEPHYESDINNPPYTVNNNDTSPK